MPNWCENTLRVVPLTDAARDMLPKIIVRFSTTWIAKGGESAFQFIHPMPSELEGTTAPGDGPNWYQWRISNWGTKWEENEPQIVRSSEDCLLVSFSTAWAPPVGVYNRLCELGFDVLATYAEQGMGFAGYWHNGDDTELSLTGVNVPDENNDYPEDWEVLEKVFAESGLDSELLPSGLGG